MAEQSYEIPEFNEHGILPPGTYGTSVGEIEARFGGPKNLQRAAITVSLIGFVNFIADFALHAYVNGSYITSKLHPGDADILVLLPADFDWESVRGTRLLEYIKNKSLNHLDIHVFKLGERVDKLHEMLNGWTHTNDVAQREKGILHLEFRK